MRRRRSAEAVNALEKNNGGGGDKVVPIPSMASISESQRYNNGNDDNDATHLKNTETIPLNKQLNGDDSILSHDTSSVHLRTFRRHRKPLIRCYILHFVLLWCVVLLGTIHNGGNRKYIPVDSKGLAEWIISSNNNQLDEGMVCHKAYVNVHSSSMNEEFSTICCTTGGKSTPSNPYASNLCHPRVPILGISTQQLPFAKRLTRMPEAWIFPMLPILIRLMYQLVVMFWSFVEQCWDSKKCQKLRKKWASGANKNDASPKTKIQREGTSVSYFSQVSSSSSVFSESSSSDPSVPLDNIVVAPSSSIQSLTEQTTALLPHLQPNSLRSTIQRIVFYFLLLNFRGWGLYIGANALEDYVILPWLTGNTVSSPMRTDSMSDEEHNLHFLRDDVPKCWYKDVLKPHHRKMMESDDHAACYGRPFDFSDHVVLFLAHYLPIFMMEMYICYLFPFWESGKEQSKVDTSVSSNNIRSGKFVWIILYVSMLGYMHLLVLYSTYQTAAYFHTPAEIFVGYGVSLVVQLPIGYLICSEAWARARRIIGLPIGGGGKSNEAGASDEKGD